MTYCFFSTHLYSWINGYFYVKIILGWTIAGYRVAIRTCNRRIRSAMLGKDSNNRQKRGRARNWIWWKCHLWCMQIGKWFFSWFFYMIKIWNNSSIIYFLHTYVIRFNLILKNYKELDSITWNIFMAAGFGGG